MTRQRSKPEPVLVEAPIQRKRIREKAVSGIQSAFPMVGRRYTLEADGVRIDPRDYGPGDYKRALLSARTLSEPVRGNLRLRDNQTGKEIQRLNNATLMQLPHYTEHNTFLIDGNSYNVNNQLRMRPGVYTRKKKNEEPEAQFNLGRGANFRVSMDPKKGLFNMEYGTTKIPLYPVLRQMGVSREQIQKTWNKGVVEKNRKAFNKKADKATEKLYGKLVHPSQRIPGERPIEGIQRAYQGTQMDPDVTTKTLGKPYDRVTPDALLDASGKLLRAYNQEEDFDERDSLEFKQLLGVDDFVKERIALDGRDLKRKILSKLDYSRTPDLKSAVPASPFTKGMRRFLSTSALSLNPTQINPMEMIDATVRVTSMGEGGIPSTRAVPDEARQVHASHLGVLDPVRTAESSRAGIDVRTSILTGRDDHGNIYTALAKRNGKVDYVPIEEAVNRTIAFPSQELKGNIDAIRGGRIVSVPAGEVDYQVPNAQAMYGPTTNLIPFLDSIDGNRANMGSKMQTQALPLVAAEPPLIQVASYRPGYSMEQEFGKMISPVAPASGRISSISRKDGMLHIRSDSKGEKTSAETVKMPLFENFPLASKTYQHQDLRAKKGDRVRKGQVLGDTPFTRDGVLSLGRNARVAYVPMRGMNSNDALVVSESAAKNFTSRHMYREGLDLDTDTEADRERHRNYFGNTYTKEQYDNLDDGGVVKPGTRINPRDPLIAALQKTKLTPEAKMLGRLHKGLVKPYKNAAVTWEHDTPGEVVDVQKSGNKIRLTVKTEEPLKLGDKLTNRYASKGVISAIIPDDQMVQDEKGRPIDIAVSPASVVTRINPAQVLETSLAKVAEKTGKPINIESYSERDNVDFVKRELKKHGLKDKETLYDPITKKKLPGVLTGPQYFTKLMKTTSTNYSARGVEDYDVNQQPATGGPRGAKSVGRLVFNALLAHDARNVLKESSVLKGQKNDEWWRAYQLGRPTPPLKPSFAYDKFGSMLAGAGIKMDKRENFLSLGPLTDKDVTKMSSGAVKNPLFVRSKDLRPERGGLFDPVLTGGLNGSKWSHVQLAEPMVNPVFEQPIRRMLGVRQKDLEDTLINKGGAEIQRQLSKIDLKERERDILDKLKTARKDQRNNLIRSLKDVRALKDSGLRPDEAYTISKVPIPPPVYRPIVPGKKGDLQVSDTNMLIRDTMLANDSVEKTKGLPDDVRAKARKHLYDTLSAQAGVRDPVSPQLANRGVKGYISRLSGAGVGPKHGFFHSKLLSKRQDLSGRGTIAPDSTLALDEVGLPEDAGWSMYSPFLIRGLARRGYRATEAKKMIEDRHPAAKDVLTNELRNRPVFINRAPSLYRYNVLAAYPKLVPGKTIRVPESLAPIQSGDFDGDAVTLTTPVTNKAIDEAKKMTLPNMLLSDQKKFTLTKAAPQQEAVLGVYMASGAKPTGAAKTFETQGDAMAAYHRGEISLSTPVNIKKPSSGALFGNQATYRESMLQPEPHVKQGDER